MRKYIIYFSSVELFAKAAHSHRVKMSSSGVPQNPPGSKKVIVGMTLSYVVMYIYFLFLNVDYFMVCSLTVSYTGSYVFGCFTDVAFVVCAFVLSEVSYALMTDSDLSFINRKLERKNSKSACTGT